MNPFTATCPTGCNICDDHAASRRADGWDAPTCEHPGCPADPEACPAFCPYLDAVEPPDEADRAALCDPSRVWALDWQLRQTALSNAHRDGRRMALAGLTLAVPTCYEDQERAEWFVRGWEREHGEREVAGHWRAWYGLPGDEQPERSERWTG